MNLKTRIANLFLRWAERLGANFDGAFQRQHNLRLVLEHDGAWAFAAGTKLGRAGTAQCRLVLDGGPFTEMTLTWRTIERDGPRNPGAGVTMAATGLPRLDVHEARVLGTAGRPKDAEWKPSAETVALFQIGDQLSTLLQRNP